MPSWAASLASCQVWPSSVETSTRSMPRWEGPGDAADLDGTSGEYISVFDRVDTGLGHVRLSGEGSETVS